MKKILLIATGGTIASGNTDSGLTPTITGDELLRAVPGLKNICEPHAVQVRALGLSPREGLRVARVVREHGRGVRREEGRPVGRHFHFDHLHHPDDGI